MRPRINSFGRITRKELESYLNENKVFGFTISRDEITLTYTYDMMFRKNKENPEMLYVKVSRASKLVLSAWTNKGIKFNTLEDLKKYTKK